MPSYDPAFEAFSKLPLRDLHKCVRFNILAELWPENSQLIVRNFFRDIYQVEEPRLLVIIGHLYLESLLYKLLDRETHNLSQHQKESFYAKMTFLNNQGKFDQDTYTTLNAINKLRNRFAHDIFFELQEWDSSVIPFVAQYNLRIPKQKNLLVAFNIILLRLTFFAVVVNLTEEYEWLYWEKIPR